MVTYFLDRKSNTRRAEIIYGESWLRCLYERRSGGLLRDALVTRPFFSFLYSRRYYRKKSRAMIAPFCSEHGIQTSDFEKKDWGSFAEFFIRRPLAEARPWPEDFTRLASPADSCLLLVKIERGNHFYIKGMHYTIEELVKDPSLASQYRGGWALVFRLRMSDCHRYYFIDDGTIKHKARIVRGRLHSVGPFTDGRIAVLKQNKRCVTVLESRRFGPVTMIEVGALTVGSIVNHDVKHFKRGDEKGWFEPGGSTIVMLFEPGRIELDKDILAAADTGLEVKVDIGEGIGRQMPSGRSDRPDQEYSYEGETDV